MLTGQWSVENLCLMNWDAEAPRPHRDGLPTHSQVLRQAGYWLGHLDKWHVHQERGPEDYGFHEVAETWRYNEWREAWGLPPRPHPRVEPERLRSDRSRREYAADLVVGGPAGWVGETDRGITPDQSRLAFAADHVIDMLERRAGEPEPFFVHWAMPEPHLPPLPPEPYASMYPPDSIPPWPGFQDDLDGKSYAQAQQKRDWDVVDWSWEQWAPYVSRYLGVVSLIDAQIGRLLDALERLDLAQNTLVIYTTDHGDPVGEHGLADQHFILYDCVMRTPLIARWPGVIPPGRECDEFVCNALDLASTFVEAAGTNLPNTFRGVSLLPAMTGGGGTGRQDILGMYHGNQFGLFSMRMVRDRRWKYIWNATAEDELYDLGEDPGEVHNLCRKPECEPELTRLRGRLVTWMEDIHDPLCNEWTRVSLLEGRTT
jgi:arylsulfatase A-like enzyme